MPHTEVQVPFSASYRSTGTLCLPHTEVQVPLSASYRSTGSLCLPHTEVQVPFVCLILKSLQPGCSIGHYTNGKISWTERRHNWMSIRLSD
jgi:hypothetical protein